MALVWRGTQVRSSLLKGTRHNLELAAIYTESTIKGLMTKGGRTSSGLTTLKAGTKRSMIDTFSGERAKKTGSFRSKEGEPPRVQTGRLRRSISHELHPALPIARVGTNVKYGKWLELGTATMAPRPFMRPGLHIAEPMILKLLGRQVK